MKGKIIGGAIIALLVIVAGAIMFSYYGSHEQTVDIRKVKEIPAGYGTDGSYYLVYGSNNQIVEIQHNWVSFAGNVLNLESINRDITLDTAEESIGKRITFECNGWNFPAFEWYPLCYKILNVAEIQD